MIALASRAHGNNGGPFIEVEYLNAKIAIRVADMMPAA